MGDIWGSVGENLLVNYLGLEKMFDFLCGFRLIDLLKPMCYKIMFFPTRVIEVFIHWLINTSILHRLLVFQAVLAHGLVTWIHFGAPKLGAAVLFCTQLIFNQATARRSWL